MPELVLNHLTQKQIADFSSQPSHAVLLVGPTGIGKVALAERLAATLLDLETEQLLNYPHVRRITSIERKAIGIEAIRDLEHFISLKIPGGRDVARIAIIEDAHLLTMEAQNALLKTLEEPPTDTVLILTAAQEQMLLPTIRSRLQIIPVKKPPVDTLQIHFKQIADDKAVKQALTISGGLPGLTSALLKGETDHPLVEAVQVARELVQANAYQRLLMVEVLSKRKDFSRDVCFVLMQMAHISLKRGGSGEKRWQAILTAAYRADEQLAASAQIKLTLSNLMLAL